MKIAVLLREFRTKRNAYLRATRLQRNQFRAEMFNVTNTPRFAFPNSAFGEEAFGNIESTTGNYRKMQFGARFQF